MIEGFVTTGFESVRDAFERCFTDLGETGASFAAIVDGRLVVDLWGGDGMRRDSLVTIAQHSASTPVRPASDMYGASLTSLRSAGWTSRTARVPPLSGRRSLG